MTLKKFFSRLLLASLTILLTSITVLGDGILIPPVGVNIAVKYHHVTVNINSQIAYTEIDQVFLNDSDVDSIEAFYVFPLPEGATFNDFSMFVDGKELTAEVLNADSARIYYENIVRSRLDPALLEYLGQGLFRARVYPIRAHGEKRIKISYSEVLNYDNGVVCYLYPLSPEKHSSLPLDSVSIAVNLSSLDPIKTVYSPSHDIVANIIDDYTAEILYTDANITPNTDFLLYYTVSSDDIGMHLLSYREPGEDGFYLLMAAPKQEVENTKVIKKRIVFVLDRSGSMAGNKIEQAKDALCFCVNSLNNEDQFNIVDFSSEVTQFSRSPMFVETLTISGALSYIDGLNATGGTNINEALLSALEQMENDTLANMIIFLTDGQPTVGVTDKAAIAQNVLSANNCNTKIFVFGVGYDVNTHLLDRLSGDNHGCSVYVSPEEDIEVAVSLFFQKVNTPVLTNLALDFGSITAYDRYPSELPDLFLGSQHIQLGRYQGSGDATIALSGEVNGIEQRFETNAYFVSGEELILQVPAYEFIPSLWAVRKVGYLIDQIRLNGENEEIINEIVTLAKRYGIITPYTSYLILEDVLPEGAFDSLTYETGSGAFWNAVNIGGWRDAKSMEDVQSNLVRYVGNKTFFMRDSIWVDSEFDSLDTPIVLMFGSEAYFNALTENPNLGPYFALGRDVIVCLSGQSYRVQSEESGTIDTGEKILPEKYLTIRNYPNPFNPITTIEIRLPEKGPVSLCVYDMKGRLVETLLEKQMNSGRYVYEWNAQNLPSGIYIISLSSGKHVKTKKTVLLK